MRARGFTLVEILIVLAIFSILLGFVFSILAGGSWNSWQIGFLQHDLQNQLRQGVSYMANELAQTNIGQVDALPSDGSYVIFRLPVGYDDSTGTIKWGATWGEDGYEGYKVRYSLVNRQLMREVLDGAGVSQAGMQKVLANEIAAATFSLANRTFEISLTAEKADASIPNPAHTLTQSLSTKITLRN